MSAGQPELIVRSTEIAMPSLLALAAFCLMTILAVLAARRPQPIHPTGLRATTRRVDASR
jgi:hypothetical protein